MRKSQQCKELEGKHFRQRELKSKSPDGKEFGIFKECKGDQLGLGEGNGEVGTRTGWD